MLSFEEQASKSSSKHLKDENPDENKDFKLKKEDENEFQTSEKPRVEKVNHLAGPAQLDGMMQITKKSTDNKLKPQGR